MNQLKKQLLCLTALVSAASLWADGTTSKIIPRSQSFNAARQIVGWDNPFWGINREPQDTNYQSFNIIFEYTRTFRDNRLARALFGDDLICSSCNDAAINISGSAVATRGANDWLADYFGLPRDFQSTVTFNPQISNFILDFNFYAGLDEFYPGMYFEIYGPFVHTKWNLNAAECITNPGTAYNGSYFQGYFSSVEVPISDLNNSFLSYANGAVPTIDNDFDGYCYGTCTPLGDITWDSLCCSKISPECGCEGGGLTRNGFGELRFVLGYNFHNNEDGSSHLGAGLYVAAPTGTRVGTQDECNSKGRYLFEPIVGNGKHWELGAQVTGHHLFWRSETEDRSFTLYMEANVTHLFGANQIRCFDLCSAGSNSRYMLAEKIGTNRNSSPRIPSYLNFSPTPLLVNPAGLQFANEYAPVANITRSNVISTIGAQGDVAFSFAYQAGNFQWDVGYNFWGRSCEKIRLNDRCCEPALGQWALKGDQRVYGFTTFNNGLLTPDAAVSMLVTDSQATIHTGSNLANNVDYTGSLPSAPQNFYADDSQLIAVGNGLPFPTYPLVTTLPGASIPLTGNTILALYASVDPVLIQESDFDLAGTRGISNKLFTHFNYAWPEMKDGKWTPYVGIGAEVEFGSGTKGCCDDGCNSTSDCNPCNTCPTNYNNYPANANQNPCTNLRPCCTNVALSQWGVWFKIGTSYN